MEIVVTQRGNAHDDEPGVNEESPVNLPRDAVAESSRTTHDEARDPAVNPRMPAGLPPALLGKSDAGHHRSGRDMPARIG